jgi:hypothetical protein
MVIPCAALETNVTISPEVQHNWRALDEAFG